jgi:hypothetical protein
VFLGVGVILGAINGGEGPIFSNEGFGGLVSWGLVQQFSPQKGVEN